MVSRGEEESRLCLTRAGHGAAGPGILSAQLHWHLVSPSSLPFSISEFFKVFLSFLSNRFPFPIFPPSFSLLVMNPCPYPPAALVLLCTSIHPNRHPISLPIYYGPVSSCSEEIRLWGTSEWRSGGSRIKPKRRLQQEKTSKWASFFWLQKSQIPLL